MSSRQKGLWPKLLKHRHHENPPPHFLCADASKPSALGAEGLESWDYLKERLKELNLHKGEDCIYA